MSVYLAEFIGTFFLILLGTSVVANVVLKGTKGYNSGWMVITTGWALAVFVGVVISAPYSGAHINPAVSIGLAFAGKFDWALVPGYVLAQLGGGILGAVVTWLVYMPHFNSSNEPEMHLAVFSTSPAINKTIYNLLCEIVGTFVLVFTINFFTDAEIQNPQSPIGLGSLGALPVAFLVWSIGLSLGGPTGYAINPARDLGPRIAHSILPIANKGSSNWKYAWIPVVGPILGGVIAAWLYLLLRTP